MPTEVFTYKAQPYFKQAILKNFGALYHMIGLDKVMETT
jgi:hypothetical protein